MKIQLLMAWCLVVGGSAQGLALENRAPVERVVVYSDRAEVTRVLSAQCQMGKASVEFGPLPVSLDARTLKAEVSGTGVVLGVTSKLTFGQERTDDQAVALRKEIQQIELQLRELNDGFQISRERILHVDRYAQFFQVLLAEEIRNPKPDAKLWGRVLDQLREERLSAIQKQSELNKKIRKLGRVLDRLQRQLGAMKPQVAGEVRIASVAIDCAAQSSTMVRLSYVLPGATWHPEYDLRFFPEAGNKVGRGNIELTVGAVVQQATGEDWPDAQLVLSTSKPKMGAEAPYPAAVYVDGAKAGEERVLVTTMERREQLQGFSDLSRSAQPTRVVLEDKGQSVSFVLPRKVTVLSDGRPYWMPVDVVSGKGESKLVTIPKLMPYVYQVAVFKNPASYPLLAGKIHSYRKGSYVGDTTLSFKAAGEPMEVSLGLDEELFVVRKDLLEQERRPGFLSSTKHLEMAYQIKVSNRARERIGIEVRENIPVSKTEEVEVELNLDKTSKGYTLDKNRGWMTWMIELQSSEEKTIELKYVIHLPKNWEIQGQ